MITSGRGPVEAQRFAGWLADHLMTELARIPLPVRRTSPVALRASHQLLVSCRSQELQRLVGTHALLWRARGAGRKRWFAAVSIQATADQATVDHTPHADEAVITTFRGRGPGGQNVNKRATAVRLTDASRGIVIVARDHRTQAANKRAAYRRWREQIAQQHEAAKLERGEQGWQRHNTVVRGRPVRTYELAHHHQLILTPP